MSILRGIARPLLVAPLALDAFDALIHPDQHAAKLEGLRPLFNKIEDSTQIDDIDPAFRRTHQCWRSLGCLRHIRSR